MAALPPSVPVCLKPGADTRPLALLVDDESFNLLLLQVLVEHLGYRAIKAENGAQAVERFAAQHPDIVLMDVTMPVMDGMEATRRIKQLAGDEHIPVIFVTALSNESELAACLAAGGDDFLSKPLSLTVLEAKIRAAERVRALQRAVNAHHNRLLMEQELARHVFAKVVEAGNSPIPGMQSLMRSADRFSGDLLLTGIGPDGSVTVLVGDFTGHGLAAALGALPATQIFRAMVAKGFDLTHIARELNQKLAGILPTGRFMAAVLARFTAGDRTCALLNSGLPDVLVVDGAGRVRQRWASQCIPLGIQSELDWDGPHWLTLEAGDWLVIATDGVSESVAIDGRPIGQSGFERILADGVPEQAVLRLERAFEAGRGEHPQTDDLTLLAVSADRIAALPAPAVAAPAAPLAGPPAVTCWSWTLKLGPEVLRRTNVIPVVLNQIRELQGEASLPPALFTVLTELFSNALEHGLLGLNSHSKDDADGFARYYMEREARLAQLQDGRISIGLEVLPNGDLRLELEDSGPGFDHAALAARATPDNDRYYSGRGIALVRALCRELNYSEGGKRVVAVFPGGS